jgi:hypothetical protein
VKLRAWVIRHKNYRFRPENLAGWSLVYEADNGIAVNACHLFLRKSLAEKYLKELSNSDHLIVEPVDVSILKSRRGKELIG